MMKTNKNNFWSKLNKSLQPIKTILKNSFSDIKKDKTYFGVVIFFIVIIIVCQLLISLGQANGKQTGSLVGFIIMFWLLLGTIAVLTYLNLHSITFFDQNYHQKKKYSIGKSIFASFLYSCIISIITFGIGKVTWIAAGGIQTSQDMAAIKSFCKNPTAAQEIPHCNNCDKSIILYSMNEGSFYSDNSSENIEIVKRLRQAQYIACLDSSTQISRTCSYDEDTEYEIKYEELSGYVYSLSNLKEKGTFTLFATPPDCPFFVNITNGVSDFPHYTEVDSNLVFKSISDLLSN